MKKIATILLLAFVCSAASAQVKVTRIWDGAQHCAFPSIEYFQGKYYVSFREGEGHVFDKEGKAAGKVRVLCSKDGRKWESVALLAKEGFDLRDPKLSVTPDGKLMLVIGGSVYEGKVLAQRIPQVAFSTDGRHFSDPEPAEFSEGIPFGMEWLWRLTWHDGTGYAVIYGEKFALVKTVDGRHFETVTELAADGFPNETTVRFTSDGRMAMMIRRESKDKRGWWGVSEAPYTEWDFVPMDLQLGGPEFLITAGSGVSGSKGSGVGSSGFIASGSKDSGNGIAGSSVSGSKGSVGAAGPELVIAGTRSYFIGKKPKTILLKGGLDGVFEEVCVLPSGGDCSYPGFRIVGDELWVVYYSSHELGHAAIYLARMPLSMFE